MNRFFKALRYQGLPYLWPFSRIDLDLRSSDPVEAERGLQNLVRLGPRIVPMLCDWLEGPRSGRLWDIAIQAAKRLQDPRLIPGLLKVIQSQYEDEGLAALEALKGFPGEEARLLHLQFEQQYQRVANRVFLVDFALLKTDKLWLVNPMFLNSSRSLDMTFLSFQGYVAGSNRPVALRRIIYHAHPENLPTLQIVGTPPAVHPWFIEWSKLEWPTRDKNDAQSSAANRMPTRLSFGLEEAATEETGKGYSFACPFFIVGKKGVVAREYSVVLEVTYQNWAEVPDVEGADAYDGGRDGPSPPPVARPPRKGKEPSPPPLTFLERARGFPLEAGSYLPFDECDTSTSVYGAVHLEQLEQPESTGIYRATVYVASDYPLAVGSTLYRNLTWEEFLPGEQVKSVITRRSVVGKIRQIFLERSMRQIMQP